VLALGEETEARRRFRRIAVQVPECGEALRGLGEIQEREIQRLREEGVFESAEPETQAARGVGLDAVESGAGEWRQEQERLNVLRLLEDWCGSLSASEREGKRQEQQEQADLESQLLARMEVEVKKTGARARIDLGIALLELQLYSAVERWLSPLVNSEDPLRVEAATILAEAALRDDRPGAAALALESLVMTPEIAETEKTALLYLRGIAAERMGKEPEAYRYLNAVQVQDPDYRDTAMHLRRLKGRLLLVAHESGTPKGRWNG
jgi:hypothetical protein